MMPGQNGVDHPDRDAVPNTVVKRTFEPTSRQALEHTRGFR
jgi:hypothetical protein